MSTEQNKAVVRRFMTEVLEAGAGADLAGFKAMLPAMGAVTLACASTSRTSWPKGYLAVHTSISGR